MLHRSSVAILLISAIANPIRAQDASIVRGGEGRRLDSLLLAAEARGFSGVALVARGGETVLHKGYGLADRAAASPFQASTVVQIGSNVKDFTKAVILQLAAEGRLTLNDTLGRFFPRAPADKRGVTIRQLLNHRAGFPQRIGSDSEVVQEAPYLERAFSRPLAFQPGMAEQYSNTGYSILAAIIQQLTGKSFDDAVQERIFERAGMRETGFLRPGFDRRRLAHGYRGEQDRGTMLDIPHAADGHWWNLRGNGGMLSTLTDMLRFYHALSGTTLLASEAARAQIMAPDEPSVLAGSDLTSFFMFGNFPGAGVQLALASNVAESPAPPVFRALVRLMGLEQGGRQEVVQGEVIPALPATGPGATVAAYIAAFNTGDTAAMRRFLTDRAVPNTGAPMEARLERYRNMFGDMGRLTPIAIRRLDDGFRVDMRSADGGAVTFTFRVDAAAPFLMQGLAVERN